jgi:Fe-S oxidoreductase
MWFDDTPEKRIGQSRIAEAIGTGARTLAVSCPFCLTMTTDGIVARSGDMTVRDIAEILADTLPTELDKTSTAELTNGL